MAIRILLVKDDAEAETVVNNLEQITGGRLQVDRVRTIADGLIAATVKPPAAILLDLKLPNGVGVEVIRRFMGQCGSIPIIVMTDLSYNEIDRQAIMEGAVGFVNKPIQSYSDLAWEIRKGMIIHERRPLYRPIEDTIARIEKTAIMQQKVLAKG